MSSIKIETINRLMRLKAAEHQGAEKFQQEAASMAAAAVGADVLQHDDDVRRSAHPTSGYMTPYKATAAFAIEVHDAIAWHAENVGRKAPPLTKYQLPYAGPGMLKDMWRARQLCDAAGIPYAFFAQQALMRWEALQRGRLPRLTQLCAPDVMTHVATLWADPAVQTRHPLPSADLDVRFAPESYTGDAVQQSVLQLIDQRMAFAQSVDTDPAEVLADVLEVNISNQEASRRYGKELVSEATEVLKSRRRDTDDMIHAIGTRATGATVDEDQAGQSMGLAAA